MATDTNTTATGFAGWDTGAAEEGDFFGMSPLAPEGGEAEALEATEPTPPEPAPAQPTSAASPKGDSGQPATEGDGGDDLYGDADGDAPDGDVSPGAASVLRFLGERGFLKVEGEVSEEEAPDLLEDRFDDAVEERIEALFSELPEAVRRLNAFVLQGGDAGEFLRRASTAGHGLTEDMDLGDEDVQEAVLRETMRAEGSDEEEVEAQLEFLRDSGRLGQMARKRHGKWLARKREAEAEMVERQREAKRRMAALLEGNGELGMLPVGREDRLSLPA